MEKGGPAPTSQAEGSRVNDTPPDYLPGPEEFELDDFAFPHQDAQLHQPQPAVGPPGDS
jgi:hypothetical protein